MTLLRCDIRRCDERPIRISLPSLAPLLRAVATNVPDWVLLWLLEIHTGHRLGYYSPGRRLAELFPVELGPAYNWSVQARQVAAVC
jgi:hypothetical protein